MNLNEIISRFTSMFYREHNNLVLTIFWNSLYTAFFLLPLGINLPTPFFVIAILLGLINIFRSRKRFVIDNKALLLFPLYFIIMALSIVYTDNISDGVDLLQRSLSLLFFPIIFLFVKEDASTVKKLFDFLLLGLVISFLINICFAGYDISRILRESITSFESPLEGITQVFNGLNMGWTHFTGKEFSKSVNPSYVSLYILLVLSYYLKNELRSKSQVFIVFILFVYLYLLASIAAYLMLIIMCVLLIFNISDKNKKYTMSLLFFLGFLVFMNNPKVFDFYSKVKDFKTTANAHIDNTTIEKSRLLTWDASIQLIKEAPILGYGIGDTNEVLIERYKELDYFQNFNYKYNAHNQFLQTFLQTGIIGFGVLITIFIILAMRMNRSRNEFAVFLILVISLFFESMLVRFNGIVFFSIIIPLLLKKRSILSSTIIRNQTSE